MKNISHTKGNEREPCSVWDRGLSFFFPPLCAACGEAGDSPLCSDCREELEGIFSPKKFLARGGNGFADEMLALFPYDNASVKKLIIGHKRDNFPEYCAVYVSFLERAVKRPVFFKKIDCVTFAPRRKWGKLTSGFDQAEVLARSTAETLGIPFETLLSRKGFGLPQRYLSFKWRKRNVHGAFRAERELSGETVLLLDDVVTTGATIREAARILKGAGAQKVYVLCYAHKFSRGRDSF